MMLHTARFAAVASAALLTSAAATAVIAPAAGQAHEPQLLVQRADQTNFWASATRAPRYVSTTLLDSVAVWDSRSGTLLRRIRVQTTANAAPDTVREVRLSADGRLAVARTDNAGLVRIDLSNGRSVRLMTGLSGDIKPLVLSPDGHSVACDLVGPFDTKTNQYLESTVVISVVTGRVLNMLPAGGSAAFSPNGRELAITTRARDRLLLADLRTGALHQLSSGSGVYGPLTFAPDGGRLVSGGDDPLIPPRGDGSFDASSTAHDVLADVWDVRERRLIQQLPFVSTWLRKPLDEEDEGSFAFGAAGELAIAGDKATTVYAAHTYRRIADVSGAPYLNDGNLSFIGKGGDASDALRFLRWTGGRAVIVATVPSGAPQASGVAIGPTGDRLAALSSYDTGRNGSIAANVWNLAALSKYPAIVDPVPNSNITLHFLTDGRLAFVSPFNVAYVVEAPRVITSHGVPPPCCQPQSAATSADGSVIFSADSLQNGTTAAAAYDATSGRRLYSLDSVGATPFSCASSGVCAFIARRAPPSTSTDASAQLSLRDAATGTIRQTLTMHGQSEGGFTDDGARLILRGQPDVRSNAPTDNVTIVNTVSGRVERSFRTQQGDIAVATIAPRVAVRGDRTTIVYDATGTPLATIEEPSPPATSAFAIWPNGTKIAFARDDGSIVVRDVRSGRVDVTFAMFLDHGAFEWLAYTPAGYFTGTPFAKRAIRWRVGDRIEPAERFSRRFDRPDKVAAALH